MNDKRRGNLHRAIDFIEKAYGIIDDVRFEEQDSMDNIPEALQASERYVRMEDACDALERSYDYCDSAIDALNDATK